MKEYYVTIMSIDTDEPEDDNHQKYGFSVNANNSDEAKRQAISQFHDYYGDLPIFWAKVN